MNRLINHIRGIVSISITLSLTCNLENKAGKSGGEIDGPWQSEARSNIPFVKGQQGPYLAFSGTRIRNGKVHNEVNLYGFGMDKWEDGKKISSTWEKWELKCQDPYGFPGHQDGTTFCQLERIIAYKGEFLSEIEVKRYSTLEGNLKVTRADWPAGVLDFEFGNLADGNPVLCELRYEQIGNAAYLRSFKGAAIKRSEISGNMFTVEYRPAEYSYTLNIPIAMVGMKPGKK